MARATWGSRTHLLAFAVTAPVSRLAQENSGKQAGCIGPRNLDLLYAGVPMGVGSPDIPRLLARHPELEMQHLDEAASADTAQHKEAGSKVLARGAFSEVLIHQPDRFRCAISLSPAALVLISVREPSIWLQGLHNAEMGRGVVDMPSWEDVVHGMPFKVQGLQVDLASGLFSTVLARAEADVHFERWKVRQQHQGARILVLDAGKFIEDPGGATGMLERILHQKIGLTATFPWESAGAIAKGLFPVLSSSSRSVIDTQACATPRWGEELSIFYESELQALPERMASDLGEAAVSREWMSAARSHCSSQQPPVHACVGRSTGGFLPGHPLSCQNYEAGINWNNVNELLRYPPVQNPLWQGGQVWGKQVWFLGDVLGKPKSYTPLSFVVHAACPLGSLAIRALVALWMLQGHGSDEEVLEHLENLGRWAQEVFKFVSFEDIENTGWADIVPLMGVLVVKAQSRDLCARFPVRGCCSSVPPHSSATEVSRLWTDAALLGVTDKNPVCIVSTSAWQALNELGIERRSGPNIVDVAAIDEIASPTFQWLLYDKPLSQCQKSVKLGGSPTRPDLPDMGAYEVCLQDASGPLLEHRHQHARECRILSIGVGFSPGDEQFEQELAEQYGCAVYAADSQASGKALPLFMSSRGISSPHHFEHAAIAMEDSNSTDPPQKTLRSLLRSLGRGLDFDIVKLTMGGGARLLSAALSDLASIEAAGVRQIIFDVVLLADMAPDLFSLFEDLDRLRHRNWRIFGRVLNPQWWPGYLVLHTALRRKPVPGNSQAFPWPEDLNMVPEAKHEGLAGLSLSFLRD